MLVKYKLNSEIKATNDKTTLKTMLVKYKFDSVAFKFELEAGFKNNAC